MLLISEIVIIWQVEEPIRYRPHQANLVTIRAKNDELTLFNCKNQLIMKKLPLLSRLEIIGPEKARI